MQNIINQVVNFSKKTKYKNDFDKENFTKFLNIFYHDVQAIDFNSYSAEDLFVLAKNSFEFFLNKKPKESKVSAYNSSEVSTNISIIDVVNDDMPFLVDSIVAYLDKSGIKILNVIHPIYNVNRDNKNILQSLSKSLVENITEKNKEGKAKNKDLNQESIIQFHIDKISSQSELKNIQENISKILYNVSLVVSDWKDMINLAKTASNQIDNAKKIINQNAPIKEIKEFLSLWMVDNFILLGAKEFNIKKVNKNQYFLEEVKDSALGVFRSKYDDFRPNVVNSSPKEVCDSVDNPYVIEILKSRYRSRIHRIANAERIRVQKISSSGEIIGEYRFIGLFTSSAYNCSINQIPLVREKTSQVIKKADYVKGGHNYKDLISVLEFYPRDELFQISVEDLLKNAVGIVGICGRSQVRFFARNDKFNRFVSCLIFLPRDFANSELRERVKDYLAKVYSGEVTDYFVQITDSNLIRLQIIVRTDGKINNVDCLVVEKEIDKMTKIWGHDLLELIRNKFGDQNSLSLFTKYRNSFSISYINRFDTKRAVIDISRIEKCLKENSLVFNIYKTSDLLEKNITELKIYSPNNPLTLSKIMPVLESFGFNVIQEHTYVVNTGDEDKSSTTKVWIHYFHVNLHDKDISFCEELKNNFEKTISLIWLGIVEITNLNKLVITNNLNWKQIYMLNAYSKHLYQIGFRYNQNYIANVLCKYHDITTSLIEFFEAKFNPQILTKENERKLKIDSIFNSINKNLNKVEDVTDDAVIRRFIGEISATLRTNYYQSEDSNFKGFVSFKFDCKKIPELPLPTPYAEIFVYSSRFEAIHLRGGKVARGGLRWSDRHEDFRTEILGLMKAQMTKNAVIVPVGSKGGFVLKRNMTGLGRDEVLKEAVDCYKNFLRGLLDLTDNVVNGKIISPKMTVLHDNIDPYLVVAADKGTATFSDYANSVSAEYNFWLGDAFASGGSAGYDHKKMGITAKGAFISVKRHFTELGIDIDKQEFTCVGIGDLAGDVFGNGMLLSNNLKLVAAFNHMHIFLDPNPDTKKSFLERERMFNLPRSTWLDYNKSLISKGGGIFERSAKSIKISNEVKNVLSISQDELSPNELIKAILKSPVDLLWNGGIGTYVKSLEESNQEVGDRNNDELRINGKDLRCKIVGEGGNLGFTQRGRIEYAFNGGMINTDAMDNSAGVDCSDHEVNIKIALAAALSDKVIDLKERNKILESMTKEVSNLVLSDNRLQTQAISIAYFDGYSSLSEQERFLNAVEKNGLLNREIEFLPSKKEIDRRLSNKIGMTRPELCVMLAYAKMNIYNQILNSNLVKDKYFEEDLFSYFPSAMQKKFPQQIANHKLRDEIIATQITNFVVNRSGISFVNRISQDSGFSIVDVVRCFIVACDSFRLRELWIEIENLSGKINHATQMKMFLSTEKLLERSIMWLLHNNSKSDLQSLVKKFRKIADELVSILPAIKTHFSDLKVDGIDKKLATKISMMNPISSAFDITEISNLSSFDLDIIAKVYFSVGDRFSLMWLRNKIEELSSNNHVHKISGKILIEDLYHYQMKLSQLIIKDFCHDKKICEKDSIEKWISNNSFLFDRFESFLNEIKSQSNLDIAVFILALDRLKGLIN